MNVGSHAPFVEQIATSALRRVASLTPPTPLEDLAASLGVSDIRYLPLAELGRTEWTPRGEIVISINSESKRSRQRFTLAHELGHVLLEVDAPSVAFRRFARDTAQLERLCDRIAARLVAPTDWISPSAESAPMELATIRKLSTASEASMMTIASRLTEVGSRQWMLIEWNRSHRSGWFAMSTCAGADWERRLTAIALTAIGQEDIDCTPIGNDQWVDLDCLVLGQPVTLSAHVSRYQSQMLTLLPGGLDQRNRTPIGP